MNKTLVCGQENYSYFEEYPTHQAFYFARKDPFKKSRKNEDCLGFSNGLVDENENIYIISDGMGGLQNADQASAQAIESCFKSLEDAPSCSLTAMKKASNAVMENSNGGGATLLMCRWKKHEVDLFSCGDSVATLYDKNGEIICKTLAQNPYHFSKESGQLKHMNAGETPPTNVLLNFVGRKELYVMSYPMVENPQGSYLFLGSDGFWENIEDEYIALIIRENTSMKDKAEKLVGYFDDISNLQEYKHDDCSFIIVKNK